MFSALPPASRSSGCHACRRMKVKVCGSSLLSATRTSPHFAIQCDEQKPSCSRCDRAGRQCPGYQAPGDRIFRSMNASVERKATKPRHRLKSRAQEEAAAAASTSDPSDEGSESGVSSMMQPNHISGDPYLALARPMPSDWDHQSICLFIEDFVIMPNEKGHGGYFDFLPALYPPKRNAPYLTEALYAASMASLGNRTSMPHLVVSARRSYGKALALVSSALRDEKLSRSDELLASLMLLTKYEVDAPSQANSPC